MALPTLSLALAVLLAPLAYFLLPYLHDRGGLRRFPAASFPAAALSDLWLLWQARHGRRHLAVHEAHARLGRFVRLQPNHVSIADPTAIPAVYGHGTGFLKSEYYDAFVSITRGLFNTRDRAQHTRKRKTISHVFSNKNVLQFEPFIRSHLGLLARQFNALADHPDLDDGSRTLDILQWANYLAFDIISDLTFGSPFGMLASGRDEAVVEDRVTGRTTTAPAIQVLSRRGDVSATLGCAPWLIPWARFLPDRFFRQGVRAIDDLAGIAVARVADRLDRGIGSDRADLLRRLADARDELGRPLGRRETEAEALTMLIAGSDTTSATVCALVFWVLRTPGVLRDLQAELDAALPPSDDGDGDGDGGVWAVPTYAAVRELKYLRAVINETLRIHSTSSLGLPRVVPAGGAVVCGQRFASGTVLSVPAYTVHRAEAVWGPDAADFRPERWFALTAEQKRSFVPFSTGPRGCVGQNVAELQLTVTVATLFSGWHWAFAPTEAQGRPGATLRTAEGFLRKPLGLAVAIKRRRA